VPDFGLPQVVTAVQTVTRETFPEIELKTLNSLEHICVFFDRYENKKIAYPSSNLRMVEFCNRVIHGELIIAAKHLNYLDSDIFGGTIMTLSDAQVKNCISEIIKARTADDFIRKLKQVKFYLMEKDEYFAPNALSFPKLLKAAYLYNHNFIKVTKAISLRADPKVIPPIYKEGKTTGLVDYYLANWPNDAGNNLYARVCVREPSLRVHTCLEDFIYAFTKAIEAYAKVKQDYDDLNSVLKCFPGETPRKQQHGHEGNGLQSRDNRKYTPLPKQDQLNYMGGQFHYREDSYLDEEEDIEESFLNLHGRELTDEEGYEDDEDGFTSKDILMTMNGQSTRYPGAPTPCFYKFKHGKCTNTGCKMDHSEAAMIQLRNNRIMELAKSPFKPNSSELAANFETYSNQLAKGKPHGTPKEKT